MGGRLHVIVRPGGLGDTLLLAPALSRLRGKGAGRVLLIGYPERLAPLVKAGLADSAAPLDRWLDEGEAILRRERESASPLLTPRVDSFFPTLPPGLEAEEMEIVVHPAFPEAGSGTHVAVFLARSLGTHRPRKSEEPLGCLALEWAGAGTSILWIHPGAGSIEKRWPVEHFLEVATEWEQRTGAEARFLLGEADLELETRIEAVGFRVCLPSSPLELSRLFSREDFFLGNDSGPTHLAALMGLQTLAIFRSSDPVLWRPWGPRAEIVISSKQGFSVEPVEVLEKLTRFRIEGPL